MNSELVQEISTHPPHLQQKHCRGRGSAVAPAFLPPSAWLLLPLFHSTSIRPRGHCYKTGQEHFRT